MIITEQEASTKRCQESFGPPLTPDGYTYAGAGPSANFAAGASYAVVTSPSMCMGSACMAWRWVVADREDTYGRSNANKGYCGKAGKP